MKLAVVQSRAEIGVHAPPVAVEVHLTGGLPRHTIVGLPETAVKESKDRVRSALLNSGFDFPDGRITVNLAPADLPKHGGRFDLPMAVGILAASGQVGARMLDDHEFLGELALTGELRPVRGSLPAALAARDAGNALVVPSRSANEAALAPRAKVLAGNDLVEVGACLIRGGGLVAAEPSIPQPAAIEEDLADVRGQYRARRALEIAAAGGHHLLMVGPPGTGKTMLALRLPGVLPPMPEDEALESASVWSASSQGFGPERWAQRPFRAPHHSASAAALVGGGSHPRPGEISLSHRGVLFLDELPEFDRRVLEVLREPLESGRVTISRAARQAEFPARFQLVAAMNPCPCGHLGDGTDRCRCTSNRIERYRGRVSGPLLDRIDLQVETTPYAREIASRATATRPECTAMVRKRVITARSRALARNGGPNALMRPAALEGHCMLSDGDRTALDRAVQRLGLSARATHRVLKVARTVADLAGTERITPNQLREALSYQRLGW